MTKGKLLLLGILSYVPAGLFLYLFGLVMYFVGGFADPDEPIPVFGLVELLVIMVCLLIGYALVAYFATLPVVKPDELARVTVFLCALLPLALPWFWHTRLWPTVREKPGRTPENR